MTSQQTLGFWLVICGLIAIIIGLAFLLSTPLPTPPKADTKQKPQKDVEFTFVEQKRGA